MKKLILFSSIILFSISVSAQKPFVLFGNFPVKYTSVDRDIKLKGEFLWSLDMVISGFEINYVDKAFKTTVLSGAGAAIGYKHYTADLISNWGVGLAVMTKFEGLEETWSRLKLGLLFSVYNITAGPSYTIGNKYPGLLVGANIRF
jgi:hypothetical protein